MTARSKRRHLQRMRLYGSLWAFVFLALAGRLVQLTLMNREDAARWAVHQHQRIVELPPDRGSILDRNGELLAISIDADSIFAVPAEVTEPEIAAAQLAPVLNRSQKELAELLASSRNFVWLRRQVPPEVAQQVFELRLDGVRFLKEAKRFYPKKALAGQLLGFLSTDGRGIEGVEEVFDSLLRGKPGRMVTEIDAKQRQLYSREQILEPRTAGMDVRLTLDQGLQAIAERELQKGVREQNAASGVVIVLDPRLGHVLAMATEPSFDPNRFQGTSSGKSRNRAWSDVFEPGSALKPFLVAGCIEAGLCRPEEIIDCEMGKYSVGGHVFEDHKPYGLLSLAEVLTNSSNIGAMKVAQRLGRDRVYETLRSFHFGQKLTEMAPEPPGRIPKPETWSATSIAAVAMGYEVMVSPLQLACAYGAIANDGLMVRPRFVLEPADIEPPEALGRVLSASTARQIRKMLEGVMEEGTGKAGKPDTLTAAGKTGTSKKLDPKSHRYSPTAVRATFVGMIPADEPTLVILVSLDEPKVNPWGGLASAPIFKAIADAAIGTLQTPPTGLASSTGSGGPLRQAQGELLEPGMMAMAAPAGPSVPRATVSKPDQLRGLSLREVLRESRRMGWAVRTEGTGFATKVTEQAPKGTTDQRSRVLVVQFESPALASASLPSATKPASAAAPPASRRER